MRSCLVTACKPFRLCFVLALTSLFSAWTCRALFEFNSCFDSVPAPQITALLPKAISAHADSALLTVNGGGFLSDSQILWNGNPLQTVFVSPTQLQTTITPQTFESFGGSAGNRVLISVLSPKVTSVVGCPNGGSSATLTLIIN